MIRLCGLWLNSKKDSGDKYFKGKLGTAEVLIFKNKNKKDEKDYDYLMYLDEHKQFPVADIEDDIPL